MIIMVYKPTNTDCPISLKWTTGQPHSIIQYPAPIFAMKTDENCYSHPRKKLHIHAWGRLKLDTHPTYLTRRRKNAYIVEMPAMFHICGLYGLHMDYTWITYGLHMDYIWIFPSIRPQRDARTPISPTYTQHATGSPRHLGRVLWPRDQPQSTGWFLPSGKLT